MRLPKLVDRVGSVFVVLGVLAAGTGAAQASRSPTAEPPRAAPRPDPRAEIFVWRGCTSCHTITGLGIEEASTNLGPDLTYAYVDVMHRYGVNLEYFLFNPVGVMELVLVSHLRIAAEDRDSIVNILRRLYEERRADIDDDVPFLPPGTVVPEPVCGNNGR